MSQTHLSESSSFWTETVLTQTLTHREFFFFFGNLESRCDSKKDQALRKTPIHHRNHSHAN